MVRGPPNKKAKGVAKIQFDDILDDETMILNQETLMAMTNPLVWFGLVVYKYFISWCSVA
jgi:hypothetical protein